MHALYIPAHDAFIRWHEVGSGTPLVCLPGLSMPAMAGFLGLATAPEFADRRFILIDYLGSGVSDAPKDFDASPDAHAETVAAVLDHLGLSHVDLFGHSMGGTVGIALALARPDLVGRLIVGEGNVTNGGGAFSLRVAGDGKDAFLNGGYDLLMSGYREKAMAGDARAGFFYSVWSTADPATFYSNAAGLVTLPVGFAEAYFAMSIPRVFLYGAYSHPDATGGPSPDTPDPDLLRRHGITPMTIPDVGHGMMRDNLASFIPVFQEVLAVSSGAS